MLRNKLAILLCLATLLASAVPAFGAPVQPPTPVLADPPPVPVSYEWFPEWRDRAQGVTIRAHVVVSHVSIGSVPVQLEKSDDGARWSPVGDVRSTTSDGVVYYEAGARVGAYYRVRFLGAPGLTPATSRTMHLGYDNPILSGAPCTPVAYELKSLQNAQFAVGSGEPGSHARIVVHGARSDGGDLLVMDEDIPVYWGASATWNGRNEKGGRLRSGVYTWTVTVTNPLRRAETKERGVLVCRTVFSREGLVEGSDAQTLSGYMVADAARVYVTAYSPFAGGDTLTLRLLGPSGFSTASRSFLVGQTTDLTTTYSGPAAPRYRGIHSLSVNAKRGVYYRVTVMQ